MAHCPPARLTLSERGLYNECQHDFYLMVSVAQLVERRTVAPVVEGSSPSTHPSNILSLR